MTSAAERGNDPEGIPDLLAVSEGESPTGSYPDPADDSPNRPYDRPRDVPRRVRGYPQRSPVGGIITPV